MTAYTDLPPKDEDANFFHNRRVKEYLCEYADKFEITEKVKFNHRVLNIERAEDYENTGGWTVRYSDDSGVIHSNVFDLVAVCTGHHAKPNFPRFPGQERFRGRIVHSHSYKDHIGYEDKIIVVIGIGNSGLDVACELARIGKQVYLSTRRGAWIIRKTGNRGYPVDLLRSRFMSWLGKLFPRLMIYLVQRSCENNMDHEVFGLKPKHRINQQHPSLSDELSGHLSTRRIIVKGNIKNFTETGLIFEDGTELKKVNECVFATGYYFDFPFLDGGKLIPANRENNCKLYKKMFPLPTTDKNTLAVIGLLQPLGSIMSLSEMQSRVFFAVHAGQCQLPSVEEMKREADLVEKALQKRYVESPRHTFQVDYTPFMSELSSMIGACPRPLDYLFSDFPLFLRLAFGPDVPYVYRLKGPFPSRDARQNIMDVERRRIKATRTRDTGFINSDTTWPTYIALAVLIAVILKFVF